MPMMNPSSVSGGSLLPRGVAYLGDSITSVAPTYLFLSDEFAYHANMVMAASVQFCGKFGEGGMGLLTPGNLGKTFSQAVAGLRAALIQPTDVVLLIGTNDLAGNTVDAIITAYKARVAELIGYGYKVVVSELTPRNDLTATMRARLHTFNAWVGRWARLSGYRCNHFYSACVHEDGSGYWASGFNKDAVHPGAAGAAAMGAVVAATFAGYKWAPYLVGESADTTSLIGGMMLSDARTNGGTAETAGDGIPDYFGKANGGIGATTTLVSVAGVVGKMAQSVIAAQVGQSVIRSFRVAASPGDVIAFGCVADTSTVSGGPALTLEAKAATTTNWHDGALTSLGTVSLSGGGYDTENAVFYCERVVPAGNVSALVDIVTEGFGASGTLRIGRVTMRNLTALGIA